jgi:hypothetical protein
VGGCVLNTLDNHHPDDPELIHLAVEAEFPTERSFNSVYLKGVIYMASRQTPPHVWALDTEKLTVESISHHLTQKECERWFIEPCLKNTYNFQDIYDCHLVISAKWLKMVTRERSVVNQVLGLAIHNSDDTDSDMGWAKFSDPIPGDGSWATLHAIVHLPGGPPLFPGRWSPVPHTGDLHYVYNLHDMGGHRQMRAECSYIPAVLQFKLFCFFFLSWKVGVRL